jgi:PAS domain S-box-containing protein
MRAPLPKSFFLRRPKRKASHFWLRFSCAVLLAFCALLPNVFIRGIQFWPLTLIGILAVVAGAMIAGPLAGWMCLLVTGSGLWLIALHNPGHGSLGFEPRVVFWTAYVGLSAVLIEVIRHMQRERRRLLEHDQRLRLARRAARIWFWEWDLHQNLLRWSRESDPNSDKDQSDEVALDHYIKTRVHPDDRERVMTSLFAAAAGRERLEIEYRVRERDGSIRWLSVKGKIFDEGGSTVMLGMASEITLQKQGDEVRSHFRAVLGSLIEGVCYVNTAGEIQYMNAAAERMLGYNSDAVRGKQLHDLLHTGCLAANGSSCSLASAMQAGHPCHIQEESLCTSSGCQLTVEYTAAPVMDSVTLGAVMMFRDISERKRAESAVRASEKMAATGRMAATISHELRNPLDSVMQLTYLLKQSGRLGDSERQQVELIDQELRRMTEVAQQTLAMHRQSSAMVPVNLGKLIDGVILLYGRKIRSHKIQLEKRYDWQGELPGFPAELRQVFTNLIVNAVDAMPSGGKVSVHVRRRREFGARNRDGVVISLLDTGTGIPAEARRHLFQPFFTTKGEKGSGVGLWVSSGIVQRHGGSIRVHSDSRPGRSYTCFQVFLPAEQALGAMPKPASEKQAPKPPRDKQQRAA